MTGKHPGLRHHERVRKNGRVVVYYYLDRRFEGLPDLPLGQNFDAAVVELRQYKEHAPRIAGTIQEAFERWKEQRLPQYESAVTRRNYAQNLTKLEPWCGKATWDGITFQSLKEYLKKRSAKTQGNRELSLLQVIWNWARGEGLTNLPWPAAGMEKSRWKNHESAREFEVTDALFEAVHAQGDQVLRDCMDLASATGMRLTDCRQILLPRGDVLRLKASKTGKRLDYDLSLSDVLPELLQRRRELDASHLMLLSKPDGSPVSATALRDRYEAARERAAKIAYLANDDEFARQIKAMWLRDMRKYSANLGTEEEAMQRTQHGSVSTLRKHYRTKPPMAKPAR